MKRLSLIFALFIPFFCFSQVNETFADGNFTENPSWKGVDTNFKINTSFQLQSNATTSSTSFLFTPSESFINASWECWVKINYTTSSSNYVSYYIVSDGEDISDGCVGYYVQVGGTNDEVSLFVQEGTKKTKIIDGKDKRTDGNPIELRIKVTRDALGNFELFSKLPTETAYELEGKITDNKINKSSFVGLFFANTTTTGSAYHFDDIFISGDKAIDKDVPVWKSLNFEQPNKLHLSFSEPINYSEARFFVNQGIENPTSIEISKDKTALTLVFSKNFEKGLVYSLEINGLLDLAGNRLDSAQTFGIVESKDLEDLVFNEVMFENNEDSEEYIEIFNKSSKVIDVSDLIFTTRKTDGELNSGIKLEKQTLMMPKSYLALTKDAEKIRKFHNCPSESKIISTNWNTLNNESSTLVICNDAKDSIYDELTYNSKWHNILVKNPKGVALEKIHPNLPSHLASSWHSAAWDINYGTPGYKNSQFIDLEQHVVNLKPCWVEPETFSPNNDGIDDICLIKYKFETPDNIAKILIFNSDGVKICQLVNNTILSTEGFIVWDGSTNDGKIANSGIYVVYIELFNPNTGYKKQYKIPIVIRLT